MKKNQKQVAKCTLPISLTRFLGEFRQTGHTAFSLTDGEVKESHKDESFSYKMDYGLKNTEKPSHKWELSVVERFGLNGREVVISFNYGEVVGDPSFGLDIGKEFAAWLNRSFNRMPGTLLALIDSNGQPIDLLSKKPVKQNGFDARQQKNFVLVG